MKAISIFIILILLSTILIIRYLPQSKILTEKNSSEPLEEISGTKENPGAASKFRYEMVTGLKDIDPSLMRSNAVKFTKENIPDYNELNDNITPTSWVTKGPNGVMFGGRVRSLIINPSNSNLKLCGSVSGGIWKSTSTGSVWNPKTDLQDPISIGSMIVDPLNSNIVYAGTGEGWVDLYGGGIYKSTNFGDNWFILPGTIGSEVSKFRNVKKMGSDYTGAIYAATEDNRYKDGVYNYSYDGGLYRSNDQGNTWTKISSSNITLNHYNPNDFIVISPSEIIYAVGAYFYQQGIYKTYDGGVNWYLITSGLPSSGYDRIALTSDPSNDSIVYAAISSTDYSTGGDAGLKGIYKSTDYGDNWTALNRPPNLVSCGGRSYLSFQGWYDNVIAVDPFNSQNIYLGGVDMVKSTNGGTSWFQLTYWDKYYGFPVVHADKHAIVFDLLNPGVIYSANDGGIYKSTNNGSTWISSSNNLSNIQFYSGAVYPVNEKYWGGTQDNGHLQKNPSGLLWNISFGGDGGYSAQHQTDPLIAYEEYVYLDMRKTTNGGTNWNSCLNGLSDATNPSLCLFIAPFAMDPENSDVLLAGSDKVWMTDDAADNWTQVSYSLSSGYLVSAVTVLDSSSDYLAFAGTTDGSIFRCDNLNPANGTSNSWTNITPPGNNGAWVRRIVASPIDKNQLYACYSAYNPSGVLNSRHLWYSGNQGNTWIDISLNLPNVPVHSIVLDTTDYYLLPVPKLYIGTETGVYTSADNGTTWQQFNTGMPTYVPVDELVIQSATKKLIAFTYGRSAWECKLDTRITSLDVSLVLEGYYNPSTNKMIADDTVRVYVRNNSYPYSIVDSSIAVVDTLNSQCNFVLSRTVTGTYYLVMKHRNSIETWSKSGGDLITQNQYKLYSYSHLITQAYASNQKQVDNAPNKYALFAGDLNQDGTIDATDVSWVDNDAFISAGGYVQSDVTGDDFVDAQDVSIVDNNSNIGASVITP